jgi:transposase
MTERAYKFRFYPTTEQENFLQRTMGCVRLVYNKAGEKIANPKHFNRLYRKLKLAQKELSRKTKCSNNREKARLKRVGGSSVTTAQASLAPLTVARTKLQRWLPSWHKPTFSSTWASPRGG